MTQVMDARTRLALRRLDSSASKNVDQRPCDALTRVAGVSLIVPEQTGVRALWCLRLPSSLKIFTQCQECAFGQRQDSGFEELGLANRNRARCKVDVTEIQPRQLSDSHPCAIG